MEILLMSGKERKRLVVLAAVKRGKLSVAAAGRLLGVGYRQAKRIWRRFKKKRRCGIGARESRQARTAAQEREIACPSAGALRGAVSGFWPHAGGGKAASRRAGGGS